MYYNKEQESKKQYGIIYLLAFYLGLVILIITAFIPIIQCNIFATEIKLNAFQILSEYGFQSERTNLLANFISYVPLMIFTVAVWEFISTTCSLSKTILPRIANYECINTFLKKARANIWYSIIYVVAAWLLILIEETNWNFSALVSGNSLFITMTYIPLILQILLYFVVSMLKPTEDRNVSFTKTSKHVKNNSSKDYVDDSRIVDILMKYKELLDSGIITQEEYNQKKQEIWRNEDEK